MPFSIKGYVLEPPRVGSSNSAYTSTPNDALNAYTGDQAAFDAYFTPGAENVPRAEYLTLVLTEGDLPDARFGWTKNQTVQRFDYDGLAQRFRTLPGAPVTVVGVLTAAANTTRLKVTRPVSTDTTTFPVRMSYGLTGSGSPFNVSVVATDADFTNPPSGTVQVSMATGNLNWHETVGNVEPGYIGQTFRYQQQTYFTLKSSNGNIGAVEANGTLLLNPKPATGQYPLIRIGFGPWLKPVEKANEAAFTTPAAGEVQWALDTGKLHFRPSIVTANLGRPVYYDGTLLAYDLALPKQHIGGISTTPVHLSPYPTEGGDIIFRVVDVGGGLVAQFPINQWISPTGSGGSFDAVGSAGTVQLQALGTYPGPYSGVDARFSAADTLAYSGKGDVWATFCDLPIEHGIRLRFFRCPVDPDATGTVNDVTNTYPVTAATLADPIIQTPQVYLPSVPLDYLVTAGSTGSLSGAAFTDAGGDFSGVAPGDILTISNGLSVGAYVVKLVNSATAITLETSGPTDTGSYEIRRNPPVLHIVQGTGTTEVDPLPRLDVALPSPTYQGYGYTIDFEGRKVQYAARKYQTIINRPNPSGAEALPDPLISLSNLKLELETSTPTVFSDLTLGSDALLDTNSGVLSFVTTNGVLVTNGTAQTFNGTTFTDTAGDFSGVQVGDLLIVADTTAKGVYTVASVNQATGPAILTTDVVAQDDTGGAVTESNLTYEIRHGRETLADRYFQEVVLWDPSTKVERINSLGPISNSPRLSIPIRYEASTRIRFADGSFSPPVSVVSSFGTPPQGTVEVLDVTGELNFAAADVAAGGKVYWSRTLVQNKEYKVVPGLGLIQFADRLLKDEEALISYMSAAGDTPVSVVEQATYIVRKEDVQPHPVPTSTLKFNPTGKAVATNPFPVVYRGGRPQTVGVQVNVNTKTSTLTFLPDQKYTTDTLPHGALIKPIERVFLDYYIYQAFGGERTTTVLQPPIYLAQTAILSTKDPTTGFGEDNFPLAGDWASSFPAGHLLRIDNVEVYLLAGATYDPVKDITTVNLASPQKFQNDYTAPTPVLYVSSGPIPTSSFFWVPSYFTVESAVWETIARGMDRFTLSGDATLNYRTGTVIMFPTLELYQVSGSSYDAAKNLTTIILTSPTIRQYTPGTDTLSRTIRPIFADNTTQVQTLRTPILQVADASGNAKSIYTVYRRTSGKKGLLLQSAPGGTDFTIDDAGRVVFTSPLQPNEEFDILYTGHTIVPAGRRLRASYTHTVAPNELNGLLDQVLTADYTVFSPDNFYFRVETYTNFRGEITKQYQADAQAAVPSAGPITSNMSQPRLYQQGRPSAFFDEGHLANEDTVARPTLKFYNDGINLLEDALHYLDGRVVGDSSGRFLFDGSVTNPIRMDYADVTNQIDDLLKVSDAPYQVTFSFPFSFSVITPSTPPWGTYQAAYLAAPTSRFFPTWRRTHGVAAQGTATGDPIYDTGARNLTWTGNLNERLAWAIVTEDVPVGATDIPVDQANGAEELARPGFIAGQRVMVQYIDNFGVVQSPIPEVPNDPWPPSPIWNVAAVADQLLTLDSPITTAIPKGATIFRAFNDTDGVAYIKSYRPGFDFGVDPDRGQILYSVPVPPLDGSFPVIPPELNMKAVAGNIPYVCDVSFTNGLVAPYKFPALYGQALNDSGDVNFPVRSPSLDCEVVTLTTDPVTVTGGHLADEDALLPAILMVTTPEHSNTGTCPTVSTLHDATGFGAVTPKLYDLIRITASNLGPTSFRRISNVNLGTKTITVDWPFFGITPTGSVTYEIAVSNSLVGPGASCTVVSPANVLRDTTRDFEALGVKVGHTVVIESGGLVKQRRQVIGISTTLNPNDTLTVSPSFTTTSPSCQYRVDNALGTFGTPGGSGSLLDAEVAALVNETALLNDEATAIETYFDLVFTDLATSAAGDTTSGHLTDATVDFFAAGVKKGNLVYIRNGTAKGVFQVTADADVLTPHELLLDTPPGAATGVTYRVVSLFGCSYQACQYLFSVLSDGTAGIDEFETTTSTFGSLLTTPEALVCIPGDGGAFARATVANDLVQRLVQVGQRATAVANAVGNIEKVLSTSDRLYDKRYTWIDGRINLQTGILAKKSRAVLTRLQAQTDALNAMVKLLAVTAA